MGKDKKPIGLGDAMHFDCDAVVLSLGARPVNGLAKALEGKTQNLFVIGDASKIGRIADATSKAYDVAVHQI